MNNPEENITVSENQPDNKNVINLNGSWEKKDRSITAAAITGLIGIGALYFNVQSLLSGIFIFIYSVFYKVDFQGGYFKRLSQTMELYKVPLLTAVTITQYLMMLLPALWVVKKWHTTDVRKYIRFGKTNVVEILLAVIITILLIPACSLISYLLLEAIHYPESFRNLGNELFTSHSGIGFIILVFIICITPAICEEVFFRGYIQRTFERTIGAKSFLLTGFLFGLFHMQPLGLFSLSILGILFSLFYYRSKSLFPSSAAHFTNNFIAIFLLNIPTNTTIKLVSEGRVPLVWIILSLPAAGLLLWVYIRITRNKKDEVLINNWNNTSDSLV